MHRLHYESQCKTMSGTWHQPREISQCKTCLGHASVTRYVSVRPCLRHGIGTDILELV
ncbi:hypothetical protein F383_31915 [Gossypium arboreum]|uniref:Uncharacterized protein n=1 Tax=Gossypium arboreum TaxID=29729 RepID=A0A0B0N434_GOSAR|nr:hypothetical protein F383_31915 [Gossypium arboreum]